MALYANLKKGDALEYVKIFGINDTNSRRFAYAEDIYEIYIYESNILKCILSGPEKHKKLKIREHLAYVRGGKKNLSLISQNCLTFRNLCDIWRLSKSVHKISEHSIYLLL